MDMNSKTLCIQEIALLRAHIKKWRQKGESIAFVPTMGNLHAGHLQLVSEAKAQADRVVVSIFVNPTQFGAGEDFSSYPRTEEEDLSRLQALAADVVFMPGVTAMYPVAGLTKVSVSGVSEGLCGAVRPGHFDGVATVVCKLFNIVQADKAFFGEKDFQQLAVIRAMVADLNSPVEIIAVPTVREPDGLAMSSRNGYLSSEQRQQAPQLYRLLCQAKEEVLARQLPFMEIEQKYTQLLIKQGFLPDYVKVCRQRDLKAANERDTQLIILAAARLGKTRLIDNIQLVLQK